MDLLANEMESLIYWPSEGNPALIAPKKGCHWLGVREEEESSTIAPEEGFHRRGVCEDLRKDLLL